MLSKGHSKASPVIVAALVALGLVAWLIVAVAPSHAGASAPTATAGASAPTATASASALARAKAAIAPYTGKPSAFPVTVPLAKRPPKGTTIAFMDCGTPVCAQFRQIIAPAAKVMGVKLTVVKTGATASTINAAFNTVLEQKPSAIINTALDPILWQSALKKIEAAHIPITSTGVVDGAKYGLTKFPNSVMFGRQVSVLSGKLQADWTFVHFGTKANIQFNWVPELSFSAVIRDAYVNEMKKLCPTCPLHLLQIPVATLGTKAPSLIISDLQAHPKTNVVAATNSEQLIGLPAAEKAAGLSGKVTTVGAAATPVNLEYLKQGTESVNLALDLPVLSWTLVDAAVRGVIHQRLTPKQAAGYPPEQLLTKKDITFNPAKGWTGYPDFAARFAKLWKVGK